MGADALTAYLQDLVAFFRGVRNGQALVDGVGQRLLAVDVLTGVDRLKNLGGVPVVGRCDEDRVDRLVVEDLVVVLDGASPSRGALDGALDASLIGVEHGDDFGVRCGLKRLDELMRASPDCDHADCCAFARRRCCGRHRHAAGAGQEDASTYLLAHRG